MKSLQASIQIGKNGLNSGTIEVIRNAFKTHNDVKIHILKSAGHDREKVREIAEKIQQELGNKFTHKIVGFTIFLKKWRKTR